MNDDISRLFDQITIARRLVLGGYVLGPLEFEGTTAAYVLPAAEIRSVFCTSMCL